MFALFYSLYYSMFIGSWNTFTLANVTSNISRPIKGLGILVTSIFNNVSTPFEDATSYFNANDILSLASFVLALITSIGIVVMSVKGIKKAFGIFFMGIR